MMRERTLVGMKDLLTLITAGKYLPAVGLCLVALVGAMRAGIGAYVPWLRTKIGGYALGFGSAVLLYVGTSLEAGSGISIGLFGSALAAGWTAAGGWEHMRDILNWLRGVPGANAEPAPAPLPRMTVVSLFALAAVVSCALFTGCHTVASEAGKVPVPSIDCTVLNGSALDMAKDGLQHVLDDHPGDWLAVAEAAAGYGVALGGCELADLVQRFMMATRGTSQDWINGPTPALEHFRSKYANGATFHTAAGDL